MVATIMHFFLPSLASAPKVLIQKIISSYCIFFRKCAFWAQMTKISYLMLIFNISFLNLSLPKYLLHRKHFIIFSIEVVSQKIKLLYVDTCF